MKHYVFTFSLLLGFSSFAHSEVENYFSIKALQSKSDASCDAVENTVINPLYKHDCEDTANGWSLSGGWIFENNVLEVSYIDLGTITSKAYFYGFPGEQTSYPQLTSNFETNASGFNISYKRLIKASENVDVFVQAGGFLYDAEAKYYRTSAGNIYSREEEKYSDDGMTLSYGFGIRLWWLELSLLRFNEIEIKDFGDSDVTSISLGFTHKF